MFETVEFRSEIAKSLDLATKEFRLKGYVPDLLPILHFLATANEDFLIQQERARTVGPQRGMQAARESLSAISMGTARYARDRGAKEMEVSDLAQFYANNYCGFWPFCR
jgi:hypothetical protein